MPRGPGSLSFLWSQKDYADARADLGYEIWIPEVFLCTAARVAASRLSPESLLDQGRFAIFFSQQFGLEIKKKKDWACLLDPSWHHCLESVLLGMAKKLIAHFPSVHLCFWAL